MTNKPGKLKSEKETENNESNAPGKLKTTSTALVPYEEKQESLLSKGKNFFKNGVKNMGGWKKVLKDTGEVLNKFNVPIVGGIMQTVGELLEDNPQQTTTSGNTTGTTTTTDSTGEVSTITNNYSDDEDDSVESIDNYDRKRRHKKHRRHRRYSDDSDDSYDEENKMYELVGSWKNNQTKDFGKKAFVPIIVPGNF